MARTRRTSLKEQIARLRPDLDRQIMDRCRQASRLAKTVKGKQAERLYAIKNRGLRQLVFRGDGKVKMDPQMGAGFLLVGIPGTGWLHTKVGWMSASSLGDTRARRLIMSEKVLVEIVDAIVEKLGSRAHFALLDEDMHVWDVTRTGNFIIAVCQDKGAAIRIEVSD